MAEIITTKNYSVRRTIGNYLSLVKFSHTIFALPFALIGFFLGVKGEAFHISWLLFLEVLLCMIFARSAAMGFNRWLDAHFDKLNPRTAKREIPAGVIKPGNALVFVIINCLLFIMTTYFINQICFYLSPVALVVILGYSYTKRFTALCHLILGLGLSLAPIGAYLAVTGHFAIVPLSLSLAVLSWVAGFDIIYALQDEDFDKSQKLHSIPSRMGVANALVFSAILHFITALLVIYLGIYGNFHWLFWCGALIFIGLLAYQHLIVKPTDLSRVGIAFANTNGIGSILFALFAIADILLLR